MINAGGLKMSCLNFINALENKSIKCEIAVQSKFTSKCFYNQKNFLQHHLWVFH